MSFFYEINQRLNSLINEGRRPDFPDLDRDGNRTEPIAQAAKQAKDMDESALQAYLGKKKYGAEGMKALQKAGRDGASKETMAKIRSKHDKMDEAEMEEGNEFSGELAKARATGAKEFKVDGKMYPVKEGRTEYDPVTGRTVHRGSYGSEYQGDDGDDDDFDQFGNRKPGAKKKAATEPGEKRGRGRPKGTGRAIGARGPTGKSKLMREQNVAEGVMSEIDIDMQEIASTQDFDKLQDAVDGRMGRATQRYLQNMMMDVARDNGLHYDDDMDKIIELAMDRIVERFESFNEANVAEASQIGDPEGRGERKAQRAQLAKDHKKLNDLEQRALDKAKKTQLPAKKNVGQAFGPSPADKLSIRGKDKGVAEDYDRDEYDEEGEMAKSFLRTIEDAAEELQSILSDNENLPEWVQKKITLAKEYVDTARDYLKANRPGDEVVAEKAVSKAQRAAAGIARAAQKGEIPKSELRGASKEMAKMPAGELKKFAKTREKGLPEKVKEVDTGEADARKTSPDSKVQQEKTFAKHRERVAKEKQDHEKEKPVKETTTAGSVATASAEGEKKSKGSMQFGKGIYDSWNRELESMISESMTVNLTVSSEHGKNLTVTATDDDADKLASMLNLAGMNSMSQQSCPSCGGMHKGSCQMEEDLANSPDPVTADLGDTKDYSLAGGLNKPKRDIAGNGQSTVPVTAISSVSEDEISRLREIAGLNR
jgi:hypothetical protein